MNPPFVSIGYAWQHDGYFLASRSGDVLGFGDAEADVQHDRLGGHALRSLRTAGSDQTQRLLLCVAVAPR